MPSFASFFTSLLTFQTGGDNGEPFTHIEHETSRTSIYTSGAGAVPTMPDNPFNFRGTPVSVSTPIPGYYYATNTTGGNDTTTTTTYSPVEYGYYTYNSSITNTTNGTVSPRGRIVLQFPSNFSSDNSTSNFTTTYAPVDYEYTTSNFTNNSSDNVTAVWSNTTTSAPAHVAAGRPRVFVLPSNVSFDNTTNSENITTTYSPITVEFYNSTFGYNTTAIPEKYTANTTGAPEFQQNYTTRSFSPNEITTSFSETSAESSNTFSAAPTATAESAGSSSAASEATNVVLQS